MDDFSATLLARQAVKTGVAAKLLEESGLSYREHAVAAGISSGALCRYAHGRIPRGAAAIAFGRYLTRLAAAVKAVST